MKEQKPKYGWPYAILCRVTAVHKKFRENYNDHVKRLILWPTEVVHYLALVIELQLNCVKFRDTLPGAFEVTDVVLYLNKTNGNNNFLTKRT